MQVVMNRIANPAMKLLLRSPLHFLASSRVLLITVTGRKSGRRYTTPVEYLEHAGIVSIVSRTDRRWWKNLESKRDVRLRLRGKIRSGVATLYSRDQATILSRLRRQYPRLSPEKAAELAKTRVIVEVALTEK